MMETPTLIRQYVEIESASKPHPIRVNSLYGVIHRNSAIVGLANGWSTVLTQESKLKQPNQQNKFEMTSANIWHIYFILQIIDEPESWPI